MGRPTLEPTRRQVAVTRSVVRWYFDHYFGTAMDPGVPSMFCDRDRVGSFAVTRTALRRSDGDALFRLLIATTMFQRRQDVQIMRILRGLRPVEVEELTSTERLLSLVDATGCGHIATSNALQYRCDLSKDPVTKAGRCGEAPATACHMKEHTVWLKRYGHFGKVPTSAALVLREAGVDSLAELRRGVLEQTRDPTERAVLLEQSLSRIWRVSEKIAAMFLSTLANPDLWGGRAPWQAGIDWTRFVVIDSNVDDFLRSIDYAGTWTYEARRSFVLALSRRVDLNRLRQEVHGFNPRLVQQAMYLFMSGTNRRQLAADCSKRAPQACRRCRDTLRERCWAARG